ncbi:MAG: UDP binding domain-containing protein, partial [Thermoplasmatota archaeon]
DAVIEDADAIIIVTKHKDYLDLDLAALKNKMATPVLIDGRNTYNREDCIQEGFIYRGVGKPR